MHVATFGQASGPAILLLHGGGVAGWMWRAQIEHLAARYRLLVPDLPGHDRSRDEPFTTSAAVVGELVRLAGDEPELTVVGFSLGGQLALQMAAEHPQAVHRLVVVSALTDGIALSGIADLTVRLAAPLARRRWFARAQAKALFIPEALMDDYLRTSRALAPESLVALTRANAAFRTPATWPAYPGRSLLMIGGKEPRSVREGMRALARANPNAELVEHPQAGHGLPLQFPDWFAAQLDRWLVSP